MILVLILGNGIGGRRGGRGYGGDFSKGNYNPWSKIFDQPCFNKHILLNHVFFIVFSREHVYSK